MPGASKLSWLMYGLLLAFVAVTLLVVGVGRRKGGRATPAVPLDDWDIPQLVAYLNGEGLALRLVPTQKNGAISQAAFLTTTDKEWDELSRLAKKQEWIGRWRGTLYCKRNMGGEELAYQWGDYHLVVGPFLFFGDPELLARVQAALARGTACGLLGYADLAIPGSWRATRG
jgi:hypothetical protein